MISADQSETIFVIQENEIAFQMVTKTFFQIKLTGGILRINCCSKSNAGSLVGSFFFGAFLKLILDNLRIIITGSKNDVCNK